MNNSEYDTFEDFEFKELLLCVIQFRYEGNIATWERPWLLPFATLEITKSKIIEQKVNWGLNF